MRGHFSKNTNPLLNVNFISKSKTVSFFSQKITVQVSTYPINKKTQYLAQLMKWTGYTKLTILKLSIILSNYFLTVWKRKITLSCLAVRGTLFYDTTCIKHWKIKKKHVHFTSPYVFFKFSFAINQTIWSVGL